MVRKTTKKTTKPATRRTSSRKSAKRVDVPQNTYVFASLLLCFVITAVITAVLLVGAKVNDAALAKDLEQGQTHTVYVFLDENGNEIEPTE